MIKYSLVLLMALSGVATNPMCHIYEGVHSEFTVRTTKCVLYGVGSSCITAKGGGFISTRCTKSCENDQPHLWIRVHEIGAEHGIVIAKKDIWTDCCSGTLCERPKVDDTKPKISCYKYSGKRNAKSADEASTCTGSTHCLTAAIRDIAVTKCVHQCSDLNKQIVTTEAKKLVIAEGHPSPSHQEIEVNCCSADTCNKKYIYSGLARMNFTAVTPKPKTDTNANQDTTGNKDETGENGANGDEWFRSWQIGYGSEADNSENASNGANYFSSLFPYIFGLFYVFYSLQ